MADIRAFKALRPKKDIVKRVAALPYDVYSRKEAKQQALKDVLSFLNIDRPETQFEDTVDMYSPQVYAKAKELLDKMINDGVYQQEERAAYYIYELTMDGRKQTGIVACASIDDYLNQVIMKHENTREDKELDRIRHVDACSAQTGPIFLAYRAQDRINQIVERNKQEDAEYCFLSEDAIQHKVWVIRDLNDIQELQSAFAGINQIYIADGHHRAASAVKVGLKRRAEHPNYTGDESFNYFLSVLFPDEELMIMPYNRVVRDLSGQTEENFMTQVKQKFDVEKKDSAYQPENKGQFGLYMNQQWYCLTAKKQILSTDPVLGLDVSILQNEVLLPLLKIEDPRTDKRIDFVGGVRGLKELEKRCKDDMQIAFSMYPTSIQELFAVADAKKLMPPKSTWFEPKLRSGIFVHKI